MGSEIGHNNPPEERPEEKLFEKKYFYMPIEEAELIIVMLESYQNIMKKYPELTALITGRIAFLRKKIGE